MSCLLSLDIFTCNSFFQFQASKKVASYPGLTFSLLVFSFLCYAFIISDMFQGTNPKTNNQILSQTNRNINLNLSNDNFFPIINIFDNDHNNYLYFDPTIWNIGLFNGDSMISLPLINCSDVLKKNPQFQGICIENSTRLNLSFYNSIEIRISLCSNSTVEDVICKPFDEIINFVSKKYLQFFFIETNFDLGNYDNPIKKTAFPSVVSILNPGMLQQYYLNLMEIEFSENKNVFFEENKAKSYYQQEYSGSEFAFYDYNNNETITSDIADIFQIFIHLSNHKRVITRKYEQLIEVVGQLGGLFSALKVFGNLFLFIFPEFRMMKKLMNSLYLFPTQVREKNDKKAENEKSLELVQNSNFNKPNIKKENDILDEKGNFDDPNISISPINQLSTYLRKDQKIESNQEYSKDKFTISIKNKNKNTDSKSNSEKCFKENKDLKDQHFLRCIEKIKTEIQAKHQFNFSFFSYLKNKIKSIFNLSTDFEGKKIILLDQIYQKEIDIEFIFKKMQDIEKLKLILLDNRQRKLFNFIKPSIIASFVEDENVNFHEKATFSKTDHSLLQNNNNNKDINDVLNIYEQKIKNNQGNLSEIDKKILNCFN